MLQVSRKVDYALRAAVYLAGCDRNRMVSFREISESQEVPKEFLAKILRTLVTTGIVDSQRGANGGYRLARPANEITFLAVVEAADGPIALNECCEGGIGCSRSALCSMEAIWSRAQRAVKDVFAGVYLSDLACEDVFRFSIVQAALNHAQNAESNA